MATSNLALTSEWQLIVAAAATVCLVSNIYPPLVEVAATAADATPPATTLRGHVLAQFCGLTRALFPSGALWARTLRDSDNTVLVVDTD